ncbi:MAG: hypothetical protein V3V67_14600, partial [Myxococcota bacterium]
ARAGGPLRVALARIAAAILSRETWKKLSYVRVGDYARERFGLSGRELQDLGRLGARLDRLPGLAAALRDGRICWSKARLIAQIATRSDEAEWIAYAKGATTKELEDRVSGSTARPRSARRSRGSTAAGSSRGSAPSCWPRWCARTRSGAGGSNGSPGRRR